MFMRLSFAFFAISAIASMATASDDGVTRQRHLKKGKGGTKSPKGSKGCSNYYGYCRMLEMGDRRLSLQYMTDRFNEEGSVQSFVDSLGYEVNLHSGRGEWGEVLSKKDCERLMSLINTDSDEDEYPFQDIQKYIDATKLVSIIGKDKFDTLLDLHREVIGATIPLEAIKIRHLKSSTDSNAYLEYHTDESGHGYGKKLSTVIIALNDNSSVKEGGDLYYLQEDGPVLAVRDQGKAFAHSYNVLHGISPHKGDRVSLILQFNHDLKLEDISGRNLTEETRRKLGCRRNIFD